MARIIARRAADPTVAGSYLAWQALGGQAMLHRGDGPEPQEGTHPALGGRWIALRSGPEVRVLDRTNGGELTRIGDAGDGPLAISDGWLVVRVAGPGEDRLDAIALATGERSTVARSLSPRELGRPALDGVRLTFHEITRAGSRLRELDLRTGRARTLRAARSALLLNPSMLDGRLVYVHSSAEGQRLRAGERRGRESGGADRTLYEIPPTARRDAGHDPGRGRHRAGYRERRPRPLPARPAPGVEHTLWTTAVSERSAYVTRLSHLGAGGVDAVLLRAG